MSSKNIYGCSPVIGNDNKFHYVYRITNLIENKHYYGVRSSVVDPYEDLGKKYFSSSRTLSPQVKKNRENYKFKIIFCFDTKKEAIKMEIKLHHMFDVGINESFYNQAKQTTTGFDTTGKMQAIDNYGNVFIISVDDVRRKTGELRGFRNNAKKVWVNDGNSELMCNRDEMPHGYVIGRLQIIKEINAINSRNRKNSIWINDGKIEKLFLGDIIPDGYSVGRLDTVCFNNKGTSGSKNPSYGKKWFTDGFSTILIYPEDAPAGFYMGLSESRIKSSVTKTIGSSFYNNGVKEIKLKNSANVPEGFSKGRLKIKCIYCGILSSKHNLVRYHNESCKNK